jgi:signal transduction histidine kinase
MWNCISEISLLVQNNIKRPEANRLEQESLHPTAKRLQKDVFNANPTIDDADTTNSTVCRESRERPQEATSDIWVALRADLDTTFYIRLRFGTWRSLAERVNLIRMMSKFKLASRRRRTLLLLTAGAVLLPAVSLVILQYRSLTKLEPQTRLAIEEDLRRTGETIGRSVDAAVQADAKVLVQQALTPLKAADLSQSNDILRQLENTRHAHPEIYQLFIFHFAPDSMPAGYFSADDGTRAFSMPDKLPNPDVLKALHARHHAELVSQSANFDSQFLPWQDPCNCPQEKASALVYIFSPLGSGNGDFTGLVLDPAYVKERYLDRVIPAALHGGADKTITSELAIAVFDDSKNQIYSLAPGSRGFEMRLGLGSVLSNWEVAIGYKNTSIAALAAANFRQSLALTALVSLILVLGVALMIRGAMRETKLAEAKSIFVSNVSHELKTPLALIRLFAETLELGRVISAAKCQEYYRIINNESLRLTRLVDNILDFSRVDQGRKEYQFVSCNLGQLVADVIKTYDYHITQAGFELTTQIDHPLPNAWVDPEAISQAVLNLVSNAIKYSDNRKKIEARVAQRDGRIAIEVRDHGIGIPASEHKKIFQGFYRVNGDQVHKSRGCGLGLAVVKHAMEAHGGMVQVESSPGKGSRFTLLIPALEPDASPQAVESDQQSVAG